MQGQGAEITSLIKNWQIPNFPISASDLMKKGYTQGPELGAELKRLEEEWLATL